MSKDFYAQIGAFLTGYLKTEKDAKHAKACRAALAQAMRSARHGGARR